MTKHGGISNQAAVFENRSQQQPIVDVANGAITGIGVGGEEQVSLFDGAVIGFLEAMNKATELADHHLALEISNHREHVILLPDTR